MKNLSKLAIISICVYANAMDVEVNKNYITELLNYKVELPKEIYNPFIIQHSDKEIKKRVVKKQNIKKKIVLVEKRLDLVAILNDKVLVKLEGFNIQKWLKVGDKIENYTLKKIINDNSILVSIRKKTKIISMKNDSNINIKVEQ